jgi:hypothetical protein
MCEKVTKFSALTAAVLWIQNLIFYWKKFWVTFKQFQGKKLLDRKK